jgi:hypothetical protein
LLALPDAFLAVGFLFAQQAHLPTFSRWQRQLPFPEGGNKGRGKVL